MPALTRAPRGGATFAEVALYTVIFALLMGMMLSVFAWMRRSKEGFQRLDIMHDLRTSSRRISDELSYATKIIFPPNDGNTYHQIVYLTETNEAACLFLDERQQLVRFNHGKKLRNERDALVVLADQTLEFSIRRRDKNYFTYKLRMLDERKLEFVLSNSINIRNDFQ